MEYDYIIVGGGPTGLTLALYLSKIGKRCLLLDQNESLGGCHRVNRTESGDFREHGPRIYSSAYKNTMKVLEEIGTEWNEVFTPYKFSISTIGQNVLSVLSLPELAQIILQFFLLTFGIDGKMKRTSMKDFTKNFNKKSIDYIDRLCRLTDGAGYERYTLYQFLQLINQNTFHSLYQPKRPNDIGLFSIWKEALLKQGVEIRSEKVEMIKENFDGTFVVNDNYSATRVLLTIPPRPFLELMRNTNLYNYDAMKVWGVPLEEWVEKVSYNNYVPISFHWKERLSLPKVWGFPKTEWGIAFIVLTDYMKDLEGTVISTCITGGVPKGKIEEEVINEVFKQLKISFPNIPDYDKALFNSGVKRDNWSETDTAYVRTTYEKKIERNFRNLYYIGTQNDRSYYQFTSMESAVTNSMDVLNTLETLNLNIDRPYELVFLLRLLLIFFICFIVWKIISR